tara:strand:+ start:659 stop:919 length:261 start_codon:yes stop_codon:yes gene_type:complete
MANPYENHKPGLGSPGQRVERSTHTVSDFTPSNVARFITCSADGALVVDTNDQESQTIQVFKGYNPIIVKKILTSGSGSMTVDCWL